MHLVRWRYAYLVAVVAITAWAAVAAPRVVFNHDYEQWFLSKDRQVENYRWFKRTFPSDEFLLIAYPTRDPFGPRSVALQKALTEALRAMRIEREPPILRSISDGIERALTGSPAPPFRPFYRVISFTTSEHAVNRWVIQPKVLERVRGALDRIPRVPGSGMQEYEATLRQMSREGVDVDNRLMATIAELTDAYAKN